MARNRSVSPPLDLASRGSHSPPPLPQSKRDKRRAVMAERLQEMISSFNANLRPHYEAQANALQVDISLILRANPFENKPLEDDPEEIQKQIQGVVGDKLPADPVAQGDFIAQAGKMYTEYVQKVNDALEQRDINLNLLHNKYQNSLHEIQQRHQFQVRLAEEEHRLLSESIRERLIASLTKKRERLLREKEQLDIGDSNALLLHPNQFSIVNPASPGAGQKRATRGTGRRGADADDSASVMTQDKRKRRAVFEEGDGQSPVPGASRADIGSGTPYRDLRARNEYTQHGAPAYSIERLFTDKELQMTTNRAAIAATNFLVNLKKQNNGNGSAANENNAAGGDENGANTATEAVIDMEMEEDATPAAPEMERVQSHHATRGATKNLLNELASAATADYPLRPIVPTYIPAVLGAKANSAPVSAAPLSSSEVEQDLAFMRRETAGDDAYNNKLLERAFVPAPRAEYQYRPPSLVPDGADGPSSLFPGIGGVPMSAQSSAAGHSEIGGLPMSRNGSSIGGVGMKRTASSSGLLGVADAARRINIEVLSPLRRPKPEVHIIDPNRGTGPLRRKPKAEKGRMRVESSKVRMEDHTDLERTAACPLSIWTARPSNHHNGRRRFSGELRAKVHKNQENFRLG